MWFFSHLFYLLYIKVIKHLNMVWFTTVGCETDIMCGNNLFFSVIKKKKHFNKKKSNLHRL